MACRLYIEQKLCSGSSVELTAEQGHYLRIVMRLKAGDPVILFNGEGGEFHCKIDLLSKQKARVLVESFADISREMACRINIIQAACRSEKIDSILQKGTELGAASFHIVRSERASLKLDNARLKKRLQRWHKIIIEAAEQSERTAIPALFWHDSLTAAPTTGCCYTLHPESSHSWAEEKANILSADEISLAIGPEGGWSDRDIDHLAAAGFSNLSFGPRIMRTETAAPALLAAIQSLQDL